MLVFRSHEQPNQKLTGLQLARKLCLMKVVFFKVSKYIVSYTHDGCMIIWVTSHTVSSRVIMLFHICYVISSFL